DGAPARCRFAFGDPAVLVAGTTERFIIAGDSAGPVAVSAGADRFRERLVRNDAVRAAARRTLAGGSYPSFLEACPVICRPGEDFLEVQGAGVDERIAYPSIRSIRGETRNRTGTVTLSTGADEATLRFTGEHNALQALAVAVRGRLAALEYAGRPRDLI